MNYFYINLNLLITYFVKFNNCNPFLLPTEFSFLKIIHDDKIELKRKPFRELKGNYNTLPSKFDAYRYNVCC